MNRSESIATLAGALAKAQGEMEAANKDNKNQFGGTYADLGSVIQAAKKPLSSNGLSVSQHPEIADGRVSITTLLMHASGEWLESSISTTVRESNALSAAQQAGIVITYLRRYALAAIVGIYADEDTDGAAVKPAPKVQPAPVATVIKVSPPPAISIAQVTPALAREAELISELTAEPIGISFVEVPPVSFEEACKVWTSDKVPVLYSTIEDKKLSMMADAISGKLLKHGYAVGTDKDNAEFKLGSIRAIVAFRKAAK